MILMGEMSWDFEFPQRPLQGRVVIVSGGSGGLGSAACVLLAREGARLVIGYRSNRARAEQLAARLERDFAATALLVEGDIRDASSRGKLLKASRSEDLEPYGLVCFTGHPGRIDFGSAEVGDLRESLEQNYSAPLLLARDCATAMRDGKVEGSIVLISSMQAVGLFPGSYNYSGPKAALVHAARVMAKEWGGPGGIRVNVVAPGVNEAGMALPSIRSGKYDRFVSDGIIPRFGRAEDVARVVRLFLEPDGYVTGQIVTVDGGLTLRG